MSELIAVNVLLEPDEPALERAGALNATLRADLGAGFAFDETHWPHVTVLQRYLRSVDLDGALAAIDGVVAARDLGGLRLRAVDLEGAEFGTPAGTLLAGVAFEPEPALVVLQEALVVALAPFTRAGGTAGAFFTSPDEPGVNASTIAYVDEYVPAHAGEHYAPHMTVGIGAKERVRVLSGEFRRFALSPGAVAVYQLGDFGTARRALKTWPLGRA